VRCLLRRTDWKTVRAGASSGLKTGRAVSVRRPSAVCDSLVTSQILNHCLDEWNTAASDGHRQPRPMYGIFVAITVMNWTFASSGSVAM
jgi:hypothetical protein